MICFYRCVIACCRPHGFLDQPMEPVAPDLLQGKEVLMVCDDNSERARVRLEELAGQYGWTRLPDGQWECGAHRAPVTGVQFTKAAVRT